VRRLEPLPAASGARFAGPADTLWTRADEGMLRERGGPVADCRTTGRQRVLERAWRSGAVFLAAGNEPSWSLRATTETLVLLLPDEAPRELPLRAPLRPGTARFVAGLGAGEVAVRLEPGPWLDTMSGDPFPLTAIVTVEGEVLRGGALYFPSPPPAPGE
jgi:uncharacterized membrane protein